MNAQGELERIVHDWLDGRVVEPSPGGLERALEHVQTVPQRRRWRDWSPRRGLGATRPIDDPEPKAKDIRRNGRMLIASGILVGISGLVLAAAVVLPNRGVDVAPGAESGATHIVAADGSGDFTTVIDAVAAAVDGDTVLVKPGTYLGNVVIDKDITLRGDGPREEVILEFGSELGTLDPPFSHPYGVMIIDSSAVVRDLMVRGPNVASAFVVVGGAPTIEHVTNELEGDFSGSPHTSIGLVHGASPTIRDSVLDGPIWEVGDPTVRGYEDVQGTHQPTITGNHLDSGIWVTVGDRALVSGNTITGDGSAIEIYRLGDGSLPLGDGSIEVVENTTPTIYIDSDGTGITIRDNTLEGLSGNGVRITLGTGSPVLEGNDVSDAQVGIALGAGATPTIRSNEISGNTTGIRVTAEDAAPLIEGNAFCGNEQDLVVPEGSTLTLDPSNEVCAS